MVDKHFIIEPVRQRFLEQRLRSVFESFGFCEISTPTIELGGRLDDVFYSNMVFPGSGLIYQCTEHPGNYAFLRPDLTISIARIVATHFRSLEKPIRLYYISNSFLCDKLQGEKETYHGGAEIIGANSQEADIELIIMSIEALQKAGLTEFQMDIGHVAFWDIIFKEAGFVDEETVRLKKLLRNKCFTSFIKEADRKDMAKDLKEIINNVPFLRGKFEFLNSLTSLSKYKDMTLLLENMTDTCRILDSYGLGDYFTIDFSMTGDLPYYSGYIFESYAKDINLFLGSGGRYDRLLGQFGYNCPATGFSINIGNAIKALEKCQSLAMPLGTPDFFITRDGSSVMTLFRIARELRRKGFLVEVEITKRNLEESLNYARNREIKSVIILGSNNLQERQILLKNMETGDETVIDFNEFLL
jgi:ATP phosphoribosyltransferase regulatory subunit